MSLCIYWFDVELEKYNGHISRTAIHLSWSWRNKSRFLSNSFTNWCLISFFLSIMFVLRFWNISLHIGKATAWLLSQTVFFWTYKEKEGRTYQYLCRKKNEGCRQPTRTDPIIQLAKEFATCNRNNIVYIALSHRTFQVVQKHLYDVLTMGSNVYCKTCVEYTDTYLHRKNNPQLSGIYESCSKKRRRSR